jgi:hypothetical protein
MWHFAVLVQSYVWYVVINITSHDERLTCLIGTMKLEKNTSTARLGQISDRLPRVSVH